MATELQPGCTGRRGKRGNEIFSIHPTKPGILIVKAKSAKKVTLDEDRKPHAAIFGCIGHLSSALINVIKIGFPKNGQGQKGANLFIKANQKGKIANAVRINPEIPISKSKKATEEFSVVMHYDKLIVAQGFLNKPNVKLEIDAETGNLTFTQESGTIEGARNSNSDMIHAVVYDTVAEACLLGKLKTRGENGTTIITLPQGYQPENLAIYVFATSANKQMASNSVCLKFPAINNA